MTHDIQKTLLNLLPLNVGQSFLIVLYSASVIFGGAVRMALIRFSIHMFSFSVTMLKFICNAFFLGLDFIASMITGGVLSSVTLDEPGLRDFIFAIRLALSSSFFFSSFALRTLLPEEF